MYIRIRMPSALGMVLRRLRRLRRLEVRSFATIVGVCICDLGLELELALE